MNPLAIIDSLGNAQLSNIENVQQDIMNQVGTISKENGYRMDVARVSNLFLDIKTLMLTKPVVSVLIGNEDVKVEDSGVTLWNSESQFHLIGYCRQEDANALLHDLLKVVVSMVIQDIVQTSYRWVIPVSEDRPERIKIFRFEFATDNSGWVEISFPVEIKNQAADFQPRT